MRLVFGIVTGSQEKFGEFTGAFALYGHIIERIDHDQIDIFLKSSTKERRIKGVIIEKTLLILPLDHTTKYLLRTPLVHSEHFVEPNITPVNTWTYEDICKNHGMILWNYSVIFLHVIENDVQKIYKCSDYIRGYIDKTKYTTKHTKLERSGVATKVTDARTIYGWDSVFCHHRTGNSFFEYDVTGYKVSARQNNISKIFQKSFHYSKNADLHHNPQHYSETVDFHNKSFAKYIQTVPEFCPTENSAINTIITNVCQQAINQGAFFRSARNRRHNGWCPGLNMGIPFTSKPKDRIHELAYQFHDCSHFNIPDLVFSGNDSPFNRFVYIAYRLMSEALTLVLADMIFVNSVFVNGGNYITFEGRKIYPVFKKMVENNPNYADNIEQFIHEVLYGSFKYCFFGDMIIWETLCGSNGDEVLDNFKNKYDSYFTADMFWTATNYDNMVKSSTVYENWWNTVKDWRIENLELESIDEFSDEFNLKEREIDKITLLDKIFEAIYEKYIRRVISTTIKPVSETEVLTNSYVRYMMGQSLLFFRFSHCSSIQSKFKLINDAMKNDKEITTNSVQIMRHFYNMCLEQLKDDGYITIDDVVSYKDVFPPFFIPNYLTGYESFSSEGKQLKDFQRDILRL
jgi:hypothetical protein